MTNEKLESISRKIAALLRTATNDGASPAERVAAEAKAAELLAKYNLEMDDLPSGDPSKAITRNVIVINRGHATLGFVYLLNEIASLNAGVIHYNQHQSTARVTVLAPEARHEMIEAQFTQLGEQLMADILADRPRSRKSYAASWASRIGGRLKGLHAQWGALVPTNIEARKHLPNNVRETGFSGLEAGSFAAGGAAADRADLGQSRLSGRRALGA